MPTNLYGPNDNFDPETSHVLPALIRRFHEARESGADEVTVWGSGTPRREFLHVDDLADALVFLMHNYDGDQFINVGVGVDVSIRELAEQLRINRNTVSRAYSELEHLGVAMTRQGLGVFISASPVSQLTLAVRRERAGEAIDAAIVQARHLDISDEEFLRLADERLKKFNSRRGETK